MEDRRIFARIYSKFTVRFLNPADGNEGEAETVDFSANGLGLVSNEYVPRRTPLDLWLSIPDYHVPLYTRGEVVWSSRIPVRGQHRLGIRLDRAELMGLARILWAKAKIREDLMMAK